jgi:hypothetical protein
MILGSPADELKRFFAKHGRAGLVLPDGWYGGPFDSLFALARAADVPDGLEIEIEGGRTLYSGAVPELSRRNSRNIRL